MDSYKIAGITMKIFNGSTYLRNRLKPFEADNPEESLTVKIEKKASIAIPDGNMILNEKVKWVSKVNNHRGYYIFSMIESLNKVSVLADTDINWKNALLQYLENPYECNSDFLKSQIEAYAFFLVGVLFRNCILNYKGFVIHGSSIDFEGKGIVFSAPSGTGKSTHVRLWEEFMGKSVKVLNDDTPAIRIIDGQACVFGTPWSGSSNKYINSSAPLDAIVIIEQSPENSIRQISLKEAVFRLMPRTFLPYYDDEMMNVSLNTFEKVVSLIPVYLLKCRPDREAMELVHQCLK